MLTALSLSHRCRHLQSSNARSDEIAQYLSAIQFGRNTSDFIANYFFKKFKLKNILIFFIFRTNEQHFRRAGYARP